MSVNLLLRRRANMAANSSSSGGGDTPGGGEESDIIYLDMDCYFLGPNGDMRVTITSESLVPYDLSIYFMGSNMADLVIPPKLDFYYGSTFDVDQSFKVSSQSANSFVLEQALTTICLVSGSLCHIFSRAIFTFAALA
jgi:hypothetical protein